MKWREALFVLVVRLLMLSFQLSEDIMAVIHIALFKWKKGTSDDVVKATLEKVKKLKSKIAGILDIFVGLNYHPESKGLTHGIVIVAENQQALDAYRSNPEHKTIAETIEFMEQDGLGFDFIDNKK
jgi:hypothetical protein